MYLSVIIPAYNEEKRIGKTLKSIGEYLRKQTYDSEVIVVNNHSKDGTADVVRSFMGEVPHMQLINETKAGKGYAVRRGILEARGQFRLFTDADNATSIEQVEKLLPYFKEEYSVVIGSIAVPSAHIKHGEPIWRVILGKLGNKWIQLWAVWGINDTQRGFKAFTAEAAERIFKKVQIFGWGFDIEVLALARKFGYRIKEVGISWDNSPDSKVNIWAYPKVLLETVKVRWNLMTGVYN